MADPRPENARSALSRLLDDDATDLYLNAPCGYLSTLPDGTIVKVNHTLSAWSGWTVDQLMGTRLQELLSVGGKVFYETHIAPLLRMQGAVREVAVDLVRVDGSLMPCLINAVEVRSPDGEPQLVRATVFEATARRRYEQQILDSQAAARGSEQRSRTLQQIVVDLAGAATVADVAAVAVRRGQSLLPAGGAGLLLLLGSGRDTALVTADSHGLTPWMVAELERAAHGSLALLSNLGGARVVTPDQRMETAEPDLFRVMEAQKVSALVVIPVRADSRTLGLLVLAAALSDDTSDGLISLTEPGTGWTPSRAELDLCTTVGVQVGEALERARLHEDRARQAARVAFLLEASQQLAAASGVQETVDRLAAAAVPRLADVCVVDVQQGRALRRMAARHGNPAQQHLADALLDFEVPLRQPDHPASAAVMLRRTQWVQVEDRDVALVLPEQNHRDVVRALEPAEMLSIPLMAAGQCLGALSLLVDRHRVGLDPADVQLAEQLALQLALRLHQEERLEAEVATSHLLQQSLLPASPPARPAPGLRSAVRYLAATRGVDVGGDFFDVAPLPDGRVAVAVGDVVGHDLTAAATMGQLRSVYRALLAGESGPAAVIERIQASWEVLGLQRMATALFATLDAADGTMRIASAGHLPPVVLAEGRARFLDVTPARMLGAPSTPAVEWVGTLPPGASLVLYTDGLVEHPGSDLDTGLARLLQVAQDCAGAAPEGICDVLVDELTEQHRADDIALLVLRRDG